jgi:hypothetical protein
MLASFPASILNQIPAESGIPFDSIKKQTALMGLWAIFVLVAGYGSIIWLIVSAVLKSRPKTAAIDVRG